MVSSAPRSRSRSRSRSGSRSAVRAASGAGAGAGAPPQRWPLPDDWAFGAFVRGRAFRAAPSATAAGEDDDGLYVQQRFCRDYLQQAGPYRGLVLYHGLGSGKTCSAIATAEALRAAGGRAVYVMLPAALHGNYAADVRRCGGRAFREAQGWALLRRAASASASASAAGASGAAAADWARSVGAKLADAHGGVWTPDAVLPASAARSAPFASLPPALQEQVRQQVDAVISATHRFVHYNGLNSSSAARLVAHGGPNPFDDAVVVVDEVHNFVSNLESGKLVKALYDRVFSARRCKVVLLSGTPLVNAPEELAWLVNLAAGPQVVFDVPYPRGVADLAFEARARACPHVLDAWEKLHVPLRVGGGGGGDKPARAGAGAGAGALRSLRLRLVPEGFVRAPAGAAAGAAAAAPAAPPGGAWVVREPGGSEERSLAAALAALDALGPSPVDRAAVRRRELELLPSDGAAFRAAFVDEARNELANADVLARRCVGAVSYFRGHDASVYPRVRSLQFEYVPLSAAQFTEYTKQRVDERRRERAAQLAKAVAASGRGGAGRNGGAEAVNVRQFSRSSCTFVFPPSVGRPRRMAIAAAAAERQQQPQQPQDAPRGGEEDTVDKVYQAALDAAIQKLRELPPPALEADAGLAEQSPKFNDITKRLSRLKGTAIVYSEFRRAEGISILAVALEANGFAQLDVAREAGGSGGGGGGGGIVAVLKLGGAVVAAPTAAQLAMPRYALYSNDDPPCTRALLAVFNNRAGEAPASVRASPLVSGSHNLRGETLRALLITQSGAEGINTRNVREVLVVEPFWHANRVEQVIGRARRAHSHDDLPDDERTIDVRIYVATLTEEQSAQHKQDEGATSDEYVQRVAERKRDLVRQLLDVMKRAAVDCDPSLLQSNKTCAIDEPPSNSPLRSHAELQQDLAQARRVHLTPTTVPGRGKFYVDKESGALYDYEAMKQRREAVQVGSLHDRA
jgi:hypothetical protein